MDNIFRRLFQKNLINDRQFELLDAIHTNRIVSLYYELRVILYLGIMLFTAGVGYFAYQNIGSIGHLISMVLIGIAVIVGFYFINRFAKPYSDNEVKVDLPYFDYLLILVSLLIISLFTYIQVYFDVVELLISWSSFITTAILMFMAYRYDNRALLAMGITALAAAVGVSITPVDWARGEWFSSTNLYIMSILLGAFLTGTGHVSEKYDVKRHFRFTYQNFGLLLYFTGCIAAMIDSKNRNLYATLLLLSSGYMAYSTWKGKEFLFFLYSNIAAYISISYLLFVMLGSINGAEILMVYYFPFSLIGYIVFLVTKKSHFSHE